MNIDTLRQKDWGSLPQLGNPAAEVRKMIRPTEANLLYTLAKICYKGDGEIVDLGAFLGGSTLAFSKGLKENVAVKNKFRRIHSFDRFIADSDYMLSYLKNTHNGENNFLEEFKNYLAGYEDYYNVYPGDINKIQWLKYPIELLFVDIAKTQAINNHLIPNFFSCLIPGNSVLVQQDFVHLHCPWVHTTMSYLWEYFELIDVVVPSLVFFNKKEIPPEKLARLAADNFTWKDKIQLFENLEEKLEGETRLTIILAKINYLLKYDFDSARAEFEKRQKELYECQDKWYLKRVEVVGNAIEV